MPLLPRPPDPAHPAEPCTGFAAHVRPLGACAETQGGHSAKGATPEEPAISCSPFDDTVEKLAAG